MVRLDKRFDKRYMYLVSYTLAKSDGNLASAGHLVARHAVGEP